MSTTQHSSRHPSVGTASRVLARDLASHPEGARATLAGWVHRRRLLASVTFVVMRDRSGLVQVVAKDPEVIASLGALPEETVVEVTGRVVHNPAAPGGAELVEPVFTPLTEPALRPLRPHGGIAHEHRGGLLVRTFAAVGWQWGGRWTRSPEARPGLATGG